MREWNPYVPSGPTIAGVYVRVTPSLVEVARELNRVLASFLPNARRGETVSKYIARHRAARSGLSPSAEEQLFHAQLARRVGLVLSVHMPGYTAESLSRTIFDLLEA